MQDALFLAKHFFVFCFFLCSLMLKSWLTCTITSWGFSFAFSSVSAFIYWNRDFNNSGLSNTLGASMNELVAVIKDSTATIFLFVEFSQEYYNVSQKVGNFRNCTSLRPYHQGVIDVSRTLLVFHWIAWLLLWKLRWIRAVWWLRRFSILGVLHITGSLIHSSCVGSSQGSLVNTGRTEKYVVLDDYLINFFCPIRAMYFVGGPLFLVLTIGNRSIFGKLYDRVTELMRPVSNLENPLVDIYGVYQKCLHCRALHRQCTSV